MIEEVRFCEGILVVFGVNAEVEFIFGVWVSQPAGLLQYPVLVRGCLGRWKGACERGSDKALIDYRLRD